MNDVAEARAVELELRKYALRVREITDALVDKKSIADYERERLRSLYAALKADVKFAAKRGKIADDRLPQTEMERAFFSPAMRDCSISMRAKTNSHPITGKWLSSLWESEMEISYFLSGLDRYCKGE